MSNKTRFTWYYRTPQGVRFTISQPPRGLCSGLSGVTLLYYAAIPNAPQPAYDWLLAHDRLGNCTQPEY